MVIGSGKFGVLVGKKAARVLTMLTMTHMEGWKLQRLWHSWLVPEAIFEQGHVPQSFIEIICLVSEVRIKSDFFQIVECKLW